MKKSHQFKIKFITHIFIIFSIFSISSNCFSEEFITLQSTTSTQNSGLYDYLLPKFFDHSNLKVKVVAVGTGQALKNSEKCDGDVLLVHSKKDEEKFVNNGFGISRYDLMYNDFIIIGPSKDPAGLISKNNIKHALKSIINSDSVFVSRGDNSGTHKAELFLWDLAKINVNDFSKNHYRELGLSMGATLNVAIQMGAYVLSDRATWLAFNNKGNHKVLFQGDKNLHNQYGIIIVNPERCKNVKLQNAQKFVNWMLSNEGQKSISSFKINGQQLFFPNAK